MSDTWLITITTTNPIDALLLAVEYEDCKVEYASRSAEAPSEAQPRADAGRSISASMVIPHELRSAAAANDGWPEY